MLQIGLEVVVLIIVMWCLYKIYNAPVMKEHRYSESTVEDYVRSWRDLDNRHIQESMIKLQEALGMASSLEDLQSQVSKLKIEKSEIEERHVRREREIEHKLGLERTRQAQELELGLREATLKVKEENLTADKKRFEDNMKFMTDRFSEEVKYLRGNSEKMLEMLPKMTIKQTISGDN